MRKHHRTLASLCHNHHLQAVVAYVAMSWIGRFGSGRALLTSSYGGDLSGDAGTFVWYFWHLKEALLGRADLFHSDRFFYPLGMDIINQDWAPVAGLIALPFQCLGPIGAYNAEVFLALVLCGYATYVLAHHVTGHRAGSLLAGAVFAFCEFRLYKSFGHLSQLNQQFLPFFLLCLLRYVDAPRLRFAVLAGLCAFLATFSSPYQLVFLLVFSLIVAVHRFGVVLLGSHALKEARILAGRLLRFAVGAGLVASLLAAPVLLHELDNVRRGEALFGKMQASRGNDPALSADLLSFVRGSFPRPQDAPFSAEGGTAFLGYSVLVLLLLGLWGLRRNNGAGLWFSAAAVFFWLSLGDFLVVGGELVGELPSLGLLGRLPILRGASVAARFVSMVALAVALVVALTVAHMARALPRRLGPRRAKAAVLLLVGLPCLELLLPAMDESWGRTARPQRFHLSSFYAGIAKEPDDFTLVHFPLILERNTGRIGPYKLPRQAFVLQTMHRKRYVGGMGDAVADATVAYLRGLPLLSHLIHIQDGKDPLELSGTLEATRRDALYAARLLDIRYVVVRQPSGAAKQTSWRGSRALAGPHPSSAFYTARQALIARERTQTAITFLEEVLAAELVEATEDWVAYRLPKRVNEETGDQDPGAVVFSRPESRAHVVPDWRVVPDPEGAYAVAPPMADPAGVLVPLRNPRSAVALMARCAPLPCLGEFRLDGTVLARVRVGGVFERHSIPLPGGYDRELGRLGWHLVRLEPEREQVIGQTGRRAPALIDVMSAGRDVGDLASIRVNGKQVAPNQRGINVVVLNAETGTPMASAAFDLVSDADGTTAQELVGFLGRFSPGAVVCVAVRDDGSLNLTAEALQAFRSLGAHANLKGRLRASWALIGVQGAAPGTALERLRVDGMARLRVSRHPEARVKTGAGGRLVGRTGVASPVPIRVVSCGRDVGDQASVQIGGAEVAPNRRGYNVVVVRPDDGSVVAAEAFDLVPDERGREARRFARTIAGIEEGMIVAVAVRDDGSANVTPEALEAFALLGARRDPRGHPRASYALIGVRGAPPGAAHERLANARVTLDLEGALEVRALEVLPRAAQAHAH